MASLLIFHIPCSVKLTAVRPISVQSSVPLHRSKLIFVFPPLLGRSTIEYYFWFSNRSTLSSYCKFVIPLYPLRKKRINSIMKRIDEN